MTAGHHAHVVELNAHTRPDVVGRRAGVFCGRGLCGSSGARGVVLGGAERLEQPQGEVALGRDLLDQRGQLLAERRQRQRPVDEQQRRAGICRRGRRRSTPEEAHQQPHRQREPEQRLRGLRRQRRAERPPRGRHPFPQAIAMLPRQRRLAAVRAHRHQPQQPVEVEAPQRARVVAHPQIALRHGRLGDERDQQRDQPERDRQPRAARVEPGQSTRDDHDLDPGAGNLSAQRRERAQSVQEVRALGHVRDRSALEVAIWQAWNLAQVERAQPLLEPGPRAAQAPRQRELEREQRHQQHHDRPRERPGTARRAAEGVAGEAREESGAAGAIPHREIDERPEQQGFGDGAQRRQHDPDGERGPAPAPVADQQAPELGRGARARLLDGGAQLGRQRRLPDVVERPGRRRPQQDGAADRDLRGAVLGGGRSRGGGVDGRHQGRSVVARPGERQRVDQAAGFGAG